MAMRDSCFSVPKMSIEICRKYLRYDSKDTQNLYAKALSYYMIYDDRYLKIEGIDFRLLTFLAKILKLTYIYPKSVISRTTAENINKSKLFQKASKHTGRK